MGEMCEQSLTVPVSSLTWEVGFLPHSSDLWPSMWEDNQDMGNTEKRCFINKRTCTQAYAKAVRQLAAVRPSHSSVSADGGS